MHRFRVHRIGCRILIFQRRMLKLPWCDKFLCCWYGIVLFLHSLSFSLLVIAIFFFLHRIRFILLSSFSISLVVGWNVAAIGHHPTFYPREICSLLFIRVMAFVLVRTCLWIGMKQVGELGSMAVMIWMLPSALHNDATWISLYWIGSWQEFLGLGSNEIVEN